MIPGARCSDYGPKSTSDERKKHVAGLSRVYTSGVWHGLLYGFAYGLIIGLTVGVIAS